MYYMCTIREKLAMQGDIELVGWTNFLVGPLGRGVKELGELSLKPSIPFPAFFSNPMSLSGAKGCS